MRTSKFFYFIIQGDSLNPLEVKDAVNLPCETFFKGEKNTRFLYQKTISPSTRWMYIDISDDTMPILSFLNKNLQIIADKISLITPYAKKYKSQIELIVCSNSINTNLMLNKKAITLLNKIGVPFSALFF